MCCGLEIIDSRYADFSFTAADVVADNTSAARVVLGPTLVDRPGSTSRSIGLLLEVDGSTVATAAGAATMGHPAEAVAMLANWLGGAGRGDPAAAGSFLRGTEPQRHRWPPGTTRDARRSATSDRSVGAMPRRGLTTP